MHFLNTILDIVFPVYCISCGTPGSDLCEKCLSLCPSAERESQDWIFPLFDYRHPPIKKAVWLIKYNGKKRLINTFGELLYGRIVEELSELRIMENFNEPILIPIPLSKKRYRERGFNQSEILCQKLIEIDQNKYLKLEKNILIKIKEIPILGIVKSIFISWTCIRFPIACRISRNKLEGGEDLVNFLSVN